MLLEILAILHAPWLRAALIWEGVGDLGGRCRTRAGGRGMWDVEGGGGWGRVWITCLDRGGRAA